MVFDNCFKKYSGNVCVIREDSTQFSYSEIYRLVEQVSGYIQPRKLVFCLSKNTIGALAGYLSFIINGTVPLMLDTKIDKELLRNLIDI